MRLILSILILCLFALSYPVCALIYPEAFPDNSGFNQEAINAFTDLRYSGYALLCAFSCLSTLLYFKHSKEDKPYSIMVLECTMILCVGDIIDRYLFNITKFETNDIVVIAVSLITPIFLNRKQLFK